MFDTAGFEGFQIDLCVMESNAFMKSIVAANILYTTRGISGQSSCMSQDGLLFCWSF